MTISRKVSDLGSSLTNVSMAPISGWPGPLKNFFKFAKDMAARFSKQMKKDRSTQLLKVVAADFELNKKR